MTNRLREIRTAAGLAAWGLATQARISPSMLSACEKWNYVPGANVRQRIATVLRCSEAEIWPELAAEVSNENAVAA